MTLARERFLTLLGLFAGLALLLATVGVYGITAQASRRGTQEIAIRSDNEDSEYHISYATTGYSDQVPAQSGHGRAGGRHQQVGAIEVRFAPS